ncbi:hypothetical protein T484DRAFT_1898613, partial [Baffinella frigidus]
MGAKVSSTKPAADLDPSKAGGGDAEEESSSDESPTERTPPPRRPKNERRRNSLATDARTANRAHIAAAIARTASNSEPTRMRGASNHPDTIMEEEWNEEITRRASLPQQRRGIVGVLQSSWDGTDSASSDRAQTHTRKDGGAGDRGGGGFDSGAMKGIGD